MVARLDGDVKDVSGHGGATSSSPSGALLRPRRTTAPTGLAAVDAEALTETIHELIVDTEYVAPAPGCAVPEPTDNYAAPTPVSEYVAASSLAPCAAPAPLIGYVVPDPAGTYVAPAPIIEYVAPAPAVFCAAPAPVAGPVLAPAVLNATPAPVLESVGTLPCLAPHQLQ